MRTGGGIASWLCALLSCKSVDCRALLRARQRFSWRGSLRRLSCRNRFRFRSSGRAQPLCLCQVPESKMAKAKVEAVRRAKCSTLPPRHGPVGTRYYCAWATGQRNHIKNLGAAHRSEQPPPPARTSPGTTDSSHHTTRRPENTPHALAGEAHLQRHAVSAVSASSAGAAQPVETDAHARPCTTPASGEARGAARAGNNAPRESRRKPPSAPHDERPLQPVRDEV